MIPEKWSMMDITLCHFGTFFDPPPLPPNNPENQIFEKMKKMPGDIIISHICTIHDNQMMYGS